MAACGAPTALAPGIAAALEEAGLVVDGRLVVGPRFETEDSAILAAGPMAKFSRWVLVATCLVFAAMEQHARVPPSCMASVSLQRKSRSLKSEMWPSRRGALLSRLHCMCRHCRVPQVRMEHYSSREVGTRLADAIADAATPAVPSPLTPESSRSCSTSGGNGSSSGGYTPAVGSKGEGCQLPHFGAAKVVGCALPGGWAFTAAARGACAGAPSLVAPPGGVSLISPCGGAGAAGVCPDGDGGGGADGSGVGPEGATGGAVARHQQGPRGQLSLIIDGSGESCQAALLAPREPALDAPDPLRPAAGPPGVARWLAALVGLPVSYVAEGLGLLQQVRAYLPAPGAACSAGGGGAAVAAGRQPVEVAAGLDRRLAEPWAEVLMHDGFAALRTSLVERCCRRFAEGQEDLAARVAAAVVDAVDTAAPGDMEGLRQRLEEARLGCDRVVPL